VDKWVIYSVTIVVVIIAALSLGILGLSSAPVPFTPPNPSKYLGGQWTVYNSYTTTKGINGLVKEYYYWFTDSHSDSLIYIKLIFSSSSYAKEYVSSQGFNTSSNLYTYVEGFNEGVVLTQGNTVVEVMYVGSSSQVPIGSLIGMAYLN